MKIFVIFTLLTSSYASSSRLEAQNAQDDIRSKIPDSIGKTMVGGEVNASNTSVMVNPTALGASGITKEDWEYFRSNEKRFLMNLTTLMAMATSPTSPENESAFPTKSTSMCANLLAFHFSYQEVHGYISLVICTIGSIGNLLNIIVLTRKDMNTSPINRILTAMSVADILLILEYIPYVTHRDLWIEGRLIEEQFSYGWSAYMWFHANFSVFIHNSSIWLTLTVAVWRFIMIKHHTLAPIYCTMPRCHVLILLAYVVPVFLSIPNYIAIDIVANDVTVNRTTGNVIDGLPEYKAFNVTKYVINWNELAKANGMLLYRMNICLYSFILKLVPSVVLTVITGFLIHALYKAEERSARLKERHRLSNPPTNNPIQGPTRCISQIQHSSHQGDAVHMEPNQVNTALAAVQTTGNNVRVVALEGNGREDKRATHRRTKHSSRRKSTDRTTRLLIVILVLFLLTEFPQGILGMLSTINDSFFYKCYNPLGDLMDDIALMNSSINFIVYCLMSKQFRKTFLETFGLVDWCARIHFFSLDHCLSKLTRIKMDRNNSDLCELDNLKSCAVIAPSNCGQHEDAEEVQRYANA